MECCDARDAVVLIIKQIKTLLERSLLPTASWKIKEALLKVFAELLHAEEAKAKNQEGAVVTIIGVVVNFDHFYQTITNVLHSYGIQKG